jgi:hypothetical protein
MLGMTAYNDDNYAGAENGGMSNEMGPFIKVCNPLWIMHQPYFSVTQHISVLLHLQFTTYSPFGTYLA